MQPYLFPYLGYFDLIHQSDEWVVFDTPQYSRHSWVNRNRILHPSEGWQYFLVPLQKHSLDKSIAEVVISDHFDWRRKMLGQLQHYQKKAPFYSQVIDLLNECFLIDTHSIVDLNVRCLGKTCEYLGLKFEPLLFSEMDIEIAVAESPGDWALMISKEMGATRYLNPPGGADLFDREAFEEAGIELIIRDLPIMQYGCNGYKFEPSLSIIDVMMWNEPQAIVNHLEANK